MHAAAHSCVLEDGPCVGLESNQFTGVERGLSGYRYVMEACRGQGNTKLCIRELAHFPAACWKEDGACLLGLAIKKVCRDPPGVRTKSTQGTRTGRPFCSAPAVAVHGRMPASTTSHVPLSLSTCEAARHWGEAMLATARCARAFDRAVMRCRLRSSPQRQTSAILRLGPGTRKGSGYCCLRSAFPAALGCPHWAQTMQSPDAAGRGLRGQRHRLPWCAEQGCRDPMGA